MTTFGQRLQTPSLASAQISGETAVTVVRQGGVLIYPTETLFAVGGDALNPAVGEQVQAIKARPEGKPLPVLLGAPEMLAMVTAWQSRDLQRLTDAFWPGPLSLLVPARPGLPAAIQDHAGWTCVRWTSHRDASWLSRQCGQPLIATSANRSGAPPAAVAEQLDPEMIRRVNGVWLGHSSPDGGLPSTLVRILSGGVLEVLRQGAVDSRALEGAGWVVRE